LAELVLMPKLGFNMETGYISTWRKKEGDGIKKGDVLLEIETDKTTMEIESTVSGMVRKILVGEGETIPVILPIAIIGEANENIEGMIREAMAQLGQTVEPMVPEVSSIESEKTPNLQVEPINDTTTPSLIDPGQIKLSPRAQKYIREKNLDLLTSDIKGTGFQGGVTVSDIEEYVKRNRTKITPVAEKIAVQNKLEISSIQGTGIGGKVTKADVENVLIRKENVQSPSQPTAQSAGDKKILRTINYAGMRKVIGDRLSLSKFTAPHLYFTTSVDVSSLMALRKQVNAAQEQKISVNDFIIGAVIKALQKYPELNSSLQGDKILQYEDVNIGVAVGLETGLIVPVIKEAQTKKISQIAKESQALAEKARNGKLLPDEYQGGTFTISNLGMFGIENFTAIINPPEAGILSISAVKKTAVVMEEAGEDKVVIKPMMNMTVSVDHRIIDGLVATRFINEVKTLIENPFNIII
jgi:pyruvate dehydrogenase E2 component (dihydrolipoamide acetyltransferase)